MRNIAGGRSAGKLLVLLLLLRSIVAVAVAVVAAVVVGIVFPFHREEMGKNDRHHKWPKMRNFGRGEPAGKPNVAVVAVAVAVHTEIMGENKRKMCMYMAILDYKNATNPASRLAFLFLLFRMVPSLCRPRRSLPFAFSLRFEVLHKSLQILAHQKCQGTVSGLPMSTLRPRQRAVENLTAKGIHALLSGLGSGGV